MFWVCTIIYQRILILDFECRDLIANYFLNIRCYLMHQFTNCLHPVYDISGKYAVILVYCVEIRFSHSFVVNQKMKLRPILKCNFTEKFYFSTWLMARKPYTQQ